MNTDVGNTTRSFDRGVFWQRAAKVQATTFPRTLSEVELGLLKSERKAKLAGRLMWVTLGLQAVVLDGAFLIFWHFKHH